MEFKVALYKIDDDLNYSRWVNNPTGLGWKLKDDEWTNKVSRVT